MLIEDLRPKFSRTRNLDLVQTSSSGNSYKLYLAGGPEIGTIEFVSTMKLCITPSVHFSQIYSSFTNRSSTVERQSYAERSNRSSLGDTIPGIITGFVPMLPNNLSSFFAQNSLPLTGAIVGNSSIQENAHGATFSITGDFKKGTWIAIMKLLNSRQQKVVGESQGCVLMRKSVRESHWVSNIELEDNAHSQLLLAAVIFLKLQ